MRALNHQNIEQWMFEHHEGLLTAQQSQELMAFIEANPQYQQDFGWWAKAKLTPDEPIFEGLEDAILKEHQKLLSGKRSVWVKYRFLITGIGCGIAAIVFWWIFQESPTASTPAHHGQPQQINIHGLAHPKAPTLDVDEPKHPNAPSPTAPKNKEVKRQAPMNKPLPTANPLLPKASVQEQMDGADVAQVDSVLDPSTQEDLDTAKQAFLLEPLQEVAEQQEAFQEPLEPAATDSTPQVEPPTDQAPNENKTKRFERSDRFEIENNDF